MRLDKNYTIEGEGYNWTLKFSEEAVNKDGKEIVRTDQWYYPSLKLALKKYADESLRVSEDIQEVIDKLNNIEETIKNITVC